MKGYIGFFDILGYKSFLKNNTDEAVQDEVLDFIKKIENPEADFYKKLFPDIEGADAEKLVIEVLSSMKRLVFSDTIVFTLEPGLKSKEFQVAHYFVVLAVAQDLMERMFEYGLPLRGALHYGEYKSSGHSMAGRGIVDAYEAGGKLNLATCVLTEAMCARFLEIADYDEDAKKVFDSGTCSYSAPLSNGTRDLCRNLKYINDKSVGAKDVREYVYRKFWEHGKDLGTASAVEKAEETERYFRYCIALDAKRGKKGR